MAFARSVLVMGAGIALLLSGMPAHAAPGVDPAQVSAKVTPSKHPYFTPQRSTKVIVSPKPGARIRSKVLTVTVPEKFTVERARLNGTRLYPSEFERKGKSLVLKASSSHGLRHGKNRITVVARHATTHLLKKQTLTVNVAHSKPLTGAGRDMFAVAGSRITVPGRVRLHPTKRNGKTPQLRWSVVRAPGKDPTVRAGKASVSFTARTPGIYRLKAVGSHRGVRSSDMFTGTITAPPMMNLDTEATRDGQKGITIGEDFYPALAAKNSPQWQVLILDSRTSAPVSNTTYGTCPNTQKMCAFTDQGSREAWIPDDLSALVPPKSDYTKSTRLVIVAGHQGMFPVHNPVEFFEAIGITTEFPTSFNDGRAHAVIGVPGMARGQAVSNDNGALKGFLLLGTSGKYGYAAADRFPFNTRVGDDCDTTSPCSVTMSIGAGDSTNIGVPAKGGFVVSVFNSLTLQRTDTASFAPVGQPKDVTAEIDRMIAFLKAVPKDSLVVVNSAGPVGAARMDSYGYDYDRPAEERDRALALAEVIEDLGGTGHEFLQSTRRLPDGTSGGDYSLIGWPGAGEGNGRQARGQKARLSGALVQDNQMRFRPSNVSEIGAEDSEKLQEILYTPQGASQWPGAGDSAYQAALRHITNVIIDDDQIGSDLRSAYWSTYPRGSTTGGLDGRFWVNLSKSAKLQGPLTAPPGKGFSDAVLEAVRKDVVQEMKWVGYTRIYFELLQAPYADQQQSAQWLNALQGLADNFQLDANSARAQTPVEVDWTVIVSALLELTGVLLAIFLPGSELITSFTEEAIEQIVELSTAVATTTTEVVGTSTEAATKHYEDQEDKDRDDEDRAYQVKARNLVTEIFHGLQQTRDVMVIHGDIVTSDHEKLKNFGTWVTSCIAKGKDCDKKTPLQAVQALQPTTKEGLERTGKTRLYQELIPLAYDVMEVPREGSVFGGYGDPEGNWDAERFACRAYHMFSTDKLPQAFTGKPTDKDYAEDVWMFKPFVYRSRESVSLRDKAVNAPTFQPYVIGIGKDNNWTFPNPKDDLGQSLVESLRAMFTPLSTNAAWTSDGLGMSPADFIREIPQRDIKKWNMTSCGGWDTGTQNVPAPLR